MSAPRLLVGARPSVVEVAVLRVPAGAVAVVEHPSGQVRDYEPQLDVEQYAAIPGSRDVLGWGVGVAWYSSLAGIRNGRLRMDRDAWHEAARLLRSEPVVYIRHEKQLYHGSWRWTAVEASSEPVTARLAEKAEATT
ncbi:hypothetical protein FXF51_05675 [Nonomuraea sp. PA05]|uniref:hypothetical protein n=1 Tax=Nonomuraea sp. PA05 TaxID=2604466 RepID=UPI0011D30302|nr:hypothetical protein [Nonomuraea sp. PA05]TYB69649.1 hypothetical protein FXF51_05675 [Nonomuraea sp. PA05]